LSNTENNQNLLSFFKNGDEDEIPIVFSGCYWNVFNRCLLTYYFWGYMVEVSFSEDVWPILEKYALTAHGGKGGVFLESYADIMSYVEPGNPEGSLLYRALVGDGMQKMPPGNPLPDELVQTIHIIEPYSSIDLYCLMFSTGLG
jgi:hypothetical protein